MREKKEGREEKEGGRKFYFKELTHLSVGAGKSKSHRKSQQAQIWVKLLTLKSSGQARQAQNSGRVSMLQL